MKLLIPFLFLPLTGSSQIPLTKAGDQINFEGIVEADSMTAQAIHEAVINWIGMSFNSAKDVIVSNSPSMVVGTFILDHNNGIVNVPIEHRLTVNIKEGKARFTITSHELSGWLVKNNGEWWGYYIKMRSRVETAFNRLFINFREAIRAAKDDDW